MFNERISSDVGLYSDEDFWDDEEDYKYFQGSEADYDDFYADLPYEEDDRDHIFNYLPYQDMGDYK